MVTKEMSGNSEFFIIPYNLYHLQGIFVPMIHLHSLNVKE